MEYSLEDKQNGSAEAKLSGLLNEDAELTLQNLIAELKVFKTVIFNFAELGNINSLGVRAWVTFLRAAAEGGRDIVFKECTPDVIMQVNMIPSFAGNAKIESFYCNYICETCDNTETVLLEVDKLPKDDLPTSYGCECGAEMVTEELEDEYFAFLMEG